MAEFHRVAVGIRYDGTRYHGWQAQANLPTIQTYVEQALSFVANHPVKTICAGRTDAGVHATAQVVHFDTSVTRTDRAWLLGANSHLPTDIRVIWVKAVLVDFSARFSATARGYRYLIFNSDVRPGILHQAIAWYHRPLDETRMQVAAHHLLGEHDFSAFRGSGCQSNTPMRNVHVLKVYRQRRMVVIDIEANAFLLHMVRNIVGVLMKVGEGSQDPYWVKQVLMSRDRRQAAMTVGPEGLYLVNVTYPDEYQVPAPPMAPFFLPL